MKRGHAEEKEAAKDESGGEEAAAGIALGEDDGAEEPDHGARDQCELDGRSRNPGESRRLLEVPLAGFERAAAVVDLGLRHRANVTL